MNDHACQSIGCTGFWLDANDWAGRIYCDPCLSANDESIPTFNVDEIIPTEPTERDLLLSILKRLTSIEDRISNIEFTIAKTSSMIDKVATEVMPTIESLASNPMIKALGIGGKFGKKDS